MELISCWDDAGCIELFKKQIFTKEIFTKERKSFRNIWKKYFEKHPRWKLSDGKTRWDAGSENLYIWQCIPPEISNQDFQICPNISESVFRFLLRNVQIFLSDGETRPDAGGENLWHCIRPKIWIQYWARFPNIFKQIFLNISGSRFKKHPKQYPIGWTSQDNNNGEIILIIIADDSICRPTISRISLISLTYDIWYIFPL